MSKPHPRQIDAATRETIRKRISHGVSLNLVAESLGLSRGAVARTVRALGGVATIRGQASAPGAPAQRPADPKNPGPQARSARPRAAPSGA